ncbi:hypothetical protein ACWD4F_42405 [Streptomyces aureus]
MVLMIEPPAGMQGRAILQSKNIPYNFMRHDPVEPLGQDRGDVIRLTHLVRGVVHENIDAPELFDRFVPPGGADAHRVCRTRR